MFHRPFGAKVHGGAKWIGPDTLRLGQHDGSDSAGIRGDLMAAGDHHDPADRGTPHHRLERILRKRHGESPTRVGRGVQP